MEDTIKELYKRKQEQLKNKLDLWPIHPTTKGDNNEQTWINFLSNFLPNRYAVTKGFVFDSNGKISDQIDIIIYDALYSPLIFETENCEKFVTIESVYAVFESKSVMNKKNLIYANEKIQSVLNLNRTSREIINAGVAQKPRDFTRILGGILTFTAIEQSILKKYLNICPNINIGCSANNGSFVVYRNEKNEVSNLQISNNDEVALSFFFIILDELTKIGTVSAIDIREYANFSLDSIELEMNNSYKSVKEVKNVT